MILALLALACSTPMQDPQTKMQDPQTNTQDPRTNRLQATPGGQRLAEAIEAHGGITRWAETESLQFTFDYQPAGAPERRMHTTNLVHVPTSRVRQEEIDGDAILGWDGSQAWITPGPEAFPSPARFWALTPYYFVAMPFVLADPGTRYELLPSAKLDGEPMDRVKVTFDPGTGDAPDDYYVAWLDPESDRLRALTYIVTSSQLFPDGGRSGEKRLSWLDLQDVDGLLLAGRYEGWHLKDGAPAGPSATVTIGDFSRNEAIPDDAFTPPDGATAGL